MSLEQEIHPTVSNTPENQENSKDKVKTLIVSHLADFDGIASAVVACAKNQLTWEDVEKGEAELQFVQPWTLSQLDIGKYKNLKHIEISDLAIDNSNLTGVMEWYRHAYDKLKDKGGISGFDHHQFSASLEPQDRDFLGSFITNQKASSAAEVGAANLDANSRFIKSANALDTNTNPQDILKSAMMIERAIKSFGASPKDQLDKAEVVRNAVKFFMVDTREKLRMRQYFKQFEAIYNYKLEQTKIVADEAVMHEVNQFKIAYSLQASDTKDILPKELTNFLKQKGADYVLSVFMTNDASANPILSYSLVRAKSKVLDCREIISSDGVNPGFLEDIFRRGENYQTAWQLLADASSHPGGHPGISSVRVNLKDFTLDGFPVDLIGEYIFSKFKDVKPNQEVN